MLIEFFTGLNWRRWVARLVLALVWILGTASCALVFWVAWPVFAIVALSFALVFGVGWALENKDHDNHTNYPW